MPVPLHCLVYVPPSVAAPHRRRGQRERRGKSRRACRWPRPDRGTCARSHRRRSANTKRKHAENKREGGHENGPKAHLRRFNRCLHNTLAGDVPARASSIMSMAFLAESAIAEQGRSARTDCCHPKGGQGPTVPSRARGTARMTAAGVIQLSYCPARTK